MPLTAPTITPTVIIPPYEETVVRPMRLRVGADVKLFGYALAMLTPAAIGVRTRMSVNVAKVPLRVRARVIAEVL